jgi:hypothetical protein
VLTPLFGKTNQKGQGERVDEKQSTIDRLKREKKVVNKTHRWSEEFNPVNGPAGQSDWPMVK